MVPAALNPIAAMQDSLSDVNAWLLYKQEMLKSQRNPKLSRTRFFLDAIRIRGSVLYRIWSSVLGITLWAAIIAAADLWYGANWKTSNSIIASLSVVVGLLIVFRNSTSYDRWWQGSAEINAAMADIRSLARFIWINVDIDAGAKMDQLHKNVQDAKSNSAARAQAEERIRELRHERLARKRRAVRLLVCYMYATKHYLRDEYSIDEADYEGVLPPDSRTAYCVLQRRSRDQFRRSIHASSATPTTTVFLHDERAGLEQDGDGAQVNERTPLTAAETAEEQEHARQPAVALPLFCLHQVTSYLAGARRAGLLTNDVGPAGFSLTNQLVNSLTSHFFNMRRIATEPLPIIYGIHLKQCVLLYLLALPLTLVSELSWRMIPVVTIVAFTLIGTEGLSSEVEMPFGDDPSDHNLDLHAATLRHELEHMMLLLDEGVREEV